MSRATGSSDQNDIIKERIVINEQKGKKDKGRLGYTQSYIPIGTIVVGLTLTGQAMLDGLYTKAISIGTIFLILAVVIYVLLRLIMKK
jgi:hypothetical protein